MALLTWLVASVCTSASSAADARLIVEAEVAPSTVMVQGQTIYTLRLWQGVALDDVRVAAPSARLADIVSLGPAVTREAVRNGQRYRVMEQRWAVLPFASGALDVIPGSVSGRVVTTGGRFRLIGAVPAVAVTPVPADWHAPWIPAIALRIEDGAQRPVALRQGEAFRRVIRMTAIGVGAAQLPAPVVAGEGVAVYPQPAQIRQQAGPDGVMSVREQAFDLLPLRAGRLEVPPVRVAWWNVAAGGRAEVAELEGFVLPGEAGGRNATGDVVGVSPSGFTGSAATVVGLLVWLLLMAAGGWCWHRSRRWRALRRACRRCDAHAARIALGDWSTQWGATMAGGVSFGQLQPGPARQAITDLERACYGPPPSEWCGDDLWRALPELRRYVQAMGRRTRKRSQAAA